MKEIMFKNSVVMMLIISLAAGFNTACVGKISAGREKNALGSDARLETNERNFNESFSETNGFENTDFSDQTGNFPSDNPADEYFDMAGEWRANFQVNNMQCVWEATFHPNGSYSSISGCRNSPYTVYYSGSWRILGAGAVRLQYTQCAPNGCPVSGETLYFQALDRNTIRLSDRIAYRIG